MTRRTVSVTVFVALLVGLLVGAGVTLSALQPAPPGTTDGSPDDPTAVPPPTGSSAGEPGVSQFENRSAFASYVEQGQLLAGDSSRMGVPTFRRTPNVTTLAPDGIPETEDVAHESTAESGSVAPSRIGTTNVQVPGLDEPDRVKTDGRNFYYAPDGRERPRPEPTRTDEIRPRRTGTTHVIDASEPADPAAIAAINTTGKLLQTGDRLVVLEADRIAGYDVSDPSDPDEVWERPLDGSVVTARERNGTVYLVTEYSVGVGTACPIEPLGAANPVACDDIYRPGTQVPVDATYTAFAIDAESGAVTDDVSFVGTAENTVVYASQDALYVTYTAETPRATVLGDYIREEFDHSPASLEQRVDDILSYDISAASKEREIRRAVDQWLATLPPEEREERRRGFQEGLNAYLGAQRRTLAQTGIVRVDVDGRDLSVDATGTVSGRPLNQFSMDQHNGTLRITTTIPGAGDADSENDLYTLDATTLEERGAVTGMGVTERVYSVRYVGDTAYVVTFRRIDPFHVVDLSDPATPEVTGELKLPGFSSYLHPIDDDHVLGVGREDGQVKAVLFDVSDPANPTVADDHVLTARWSAIAESHHAFTIDRRHGVFFLPAGDAGVVMNYTDGTLDVETTVATDGQAQRARYVEDFLYVFAQDAITVIDETTWTDVGTLPLS